MGENVGDGGGTVYILVGETFDVLADASRGKLCTHKARMSPPTN